MPVDILIGPLEVEDRLAGVKRAYAASVLIRSPDSYERVQRFAQVLPDVQLALPLPSAHPRDHHGPQADIGIYDVAAFAGNDALAKPVGVSWPADEIVQARQGTRTLLLRNVMQEKFRSLIVPTAELLIAEDQLEYVQSKANFDLILLHELAHGLDPMIRRGGDPKQGGHWGPINMRLRRRARTSLPCSSPIISTAQGCWKNVN